MSPQRKLKDVDNKEIQEGQEIELQSSYSKIFLYLLWDDRDKFFQWN